MYTSIFQCKQYNHSKVNLDTSKLTWNVLKDVKIYFKLSSLKFWKISGIYAVYGVSHVGEQANFEAYL